MQITRRHLIRGGLAVGALALVGTYAAPYLLNEYIPTDEEELAASQGTSNGQLEKTSTTTYQAGEPFDVVGLEDEKEGEDFTQANLLGWVGTMRFTAYEPVLFKVTDDVGADITISDENIEYLVRVQINVENIDAVCKERAYNGLGVPNFAVGMFNVDIPDDNYETFEETFWSDNPLPEGEYANGGPNSYTWVDPGESVTIYALYSIRHYSNEANEHGVPNAYDGAADGKELYLKMIAQPYRVALGVAKPWDGSDVS